jgi:HEAT repeat protein
MRTLLASVLCLGALLGCGAHAATLPDGLTNCPTYSFGQSREPLRQLELAVAGSLTNQTLRADLEAGFIRVLSGPASYEAKKFACEQLAIIGSAEVVPALAPLLTDPAQVGIACLALRSNPSAQADQVLRTALAQTDGMPRIQIIHTLGDRRDPQSVPDLARQARLSAPGIASAAIAALGKIGDDAAHAALTSLRSEASPDLAPVLAEAFLRVAERRVAEANLAAAKGLFESLLAKGNLPGVRRGALSALLALDADGGTRRILTLLNGEDSTLQPTAIAAIDTLVGTDVSRSFGLELPNLKPGLQVLLIEALASRGDGEARAAISSHIHDQDPAVRLATIRALGRLGGESAVNVLASALSDASTTEEAAAVQSALIGLPAEAALDQAILEACREASAETKPLWIAVVGQRRMRGARAMLLAETGNATNAIAHAAWQALGRLATADDAPELLVRFNSLPAAVEHDSAASAITRALLQTDDVASRSALLRSALAQAGNVQNRCSLLRLLPQAADAEALALLETSARDANPLVADAALRALAHWPDPSAWDLLWEFYRQSPSVPHRSLAVRALVRLAGEQNREPDPAWVERYRALLDNAREDAELKLILGALGGMAHPDALDLALAQLDRPEVRAEAALTVQRIAESIKDQYPEAAREALRKAD